ncbi:unnamed protein product [Arabidopsis thaliana]|uniref:F-box domain-containing protein n=1 Tax=Arabidopsis thaliana TaxID=3702 RepID=A0A654F5A5_ARATH|nr:unnamed protein product [Arabidopsis thaliana]
MSYPERKRKRSRWSKPHSTQNPSPSLPDDVLLSIFARVSRLYYPTLSHVSESFRSLLASPELYKARSLSGNTEICLYVCLRCSTGYRWFSLSRKPDQTLTYEERKSSGYALARVPIPGGSPNVRSSSLVAVGSDIYNICGSINKASSSSSVSILDCQSHTWREAPSLPVELSSISASVRDGNQGGHGYSDSRKNSFKVFAYNSKEGRWDHLVGLGAGSFMLPDSYCVIDNVSYSVSDGMFRWYDTEVRRWKDLRGLFQLPKFSAGACVILADYGGKMAVLWDQLPYHHGFHKTIQCAVIALERRTSFVFREKSCQIWGKVEWVDDLLTVPTSYDLVKVLVATI